PAEVQRAKVRLLGIEDLADFVVISGEFGAAKPDPAIFAEALRLGSASALDAVMVGDMLEFDVAGARASGIASVWINHGGGDVSSGTVRPDYAVRSVSEAPQLLRSLMENEGEGRAHRVP
ncbi:MAG: HAD family hydrolase, partial [Thermomicrobiales bacterium]|nr:HAD family hydrolase [Thermomicrobiales bacterium]